MNTYIEGLQFAFVVLNHRRIHSKKKITISKLKLNAKFLQPKQLKGFV